MKFPKKVTGFLNKCIWIGWGRFSLLWREYLPSAVNVLRDGRKISDFTNREVFQLNLAQIDEK